MSARILVVDDIETNRRLLEARLTAEYFDVLQAENGANCLKIAAEEGPDLILLDVMMPGMDGFEVCRRLKADAKLRHIPVIMVTALDQREDRIKGLKAGADEFLTKPVDDIALFARVRSLLRLKAVMDELRLRDSGTMPAEIQTKTDARVTVVAGDADTAKRIASKLDKPIRAVAHCDPLEAMHSARASDLMIIDLSSPRFDGMRLCARIRSDAATRQLPILAVVSGEDRATMVRALDLGVNDIVWRPIDPIEINARTATLIQRKNYADALRDRLEESLEMAVTDSLTGLYNRRYIMSRLRQALDGAQSSGDRVSVGLFDLDHFKSINDTYGHQAGDRVIKGFAERAGGQLRALDIAGRYGGEEFLVIFAGAPIHAAIEAAERLRAAMVAQPFIIDTNGASVAVTVSAGVAEAAPGDDIDDLIGRADVALYDAKASGRNQVRDWKRPRSKTG